MLRRVGVAGGLYGLLLVLAMLWADAQGRGLPYSHPSPWLVLDTPCRLALGLGLGLAVAWAVIRGSRWLVERKQWARRLHLEFRAIIEPMSSLEIAFFASISALAEEAFFRGAMQPSLGLVLSSLLFGAAHVAPSRALLPWTAWAVVMGFVFGGIYALTGELLGPMVAHALINYTNMHFIRDFDPG